MSHIDQGVISTLKVSIDLVIFLSLFSNKNSKRRQRNEDGEVFVAFGSYVIKLKAYIKWAILY